MEFRLLKFKFLGVQDRAGAGSGRRVWGVMGNIQVFRYFLFVTRPLATWLGRNPEDKRPRFGCFQACHHLGFGTWASNFLVVSRAVRVPVKGVFRKRGYRTYMLYYAVLYAYVAIGCRAIH